jgi:soluble lytic murein transglycosylase-like protein
MQSFAFCNRCRGMKVGWNRRYVRHSLFCRELLAKTIKSTVLTGLLSSFVFAFPVSTAVAPALPQLVSWDVYAASPAVDAKKTAVIEKMLEDHRVYREHLSRVAQAIVVSSNKYMVDPRLVASIVIVESSADPFAVSDAGAVGIMQIHLGTWGDLADRENIKLFKIEDNVDLGVRILRDYIKGSDVWEGVARYRGKTDSPESQATAAEYVQKVQRIYGFTPKV